MALSLLFTTAIIMVNVGMTIGNKFFQSFTNQITSGIAVILVALSVFICSFMKSFAGFLVFYGIFYGASIGIGYLPPLKNTYLHLPARKGLCSGICMSGFGFGSVIFNEIILLLVNPNDMKADENNRFPKEIADNLPFALRILALIYLTLGLAGTFFVRPPKKSEKREIFDSIDSNSILTGEPVASS